MALWVAPVSSLPRGGPGQTMAGRRSERVDTGSTPPPAPGWLHAAVRLRWALPLSCSWGVGKAQGYWEWVLVGATGIGWVDVGYWEPSCQDDGFLL